MFMHSYGPLLKHASKLTEPNDDKNELPRKFQKVI